MKKITNLVLTTFITLSASSTFANDITVVNSHTCARAKGTTQPFMLILYKGENIMRSVAKCADDANLSGASLTGLGALQDPVVNYFNLTTKKYQDKTLAGDYELISLNGDIAKNNQKHVVHMHATLGDDQYRVFGGHLSDGIVAVTAEITIIPFQGKLDRKLDKRIGAALISTNA